MKNVLIFACVAGIAAAVAIYFVSQQDQEEYESDYITEEDIAAFDLDENTGVAQSI